MSSLAIHRAFLSDGQQASSRSAFSGLRLFAYAGIGLTLVGLTKAGILRRQTITPVAIGAVAIAMWHGAYDAVQGRPLFEPWFGQRWRVAFTTAYLTLAGVTLLGWVLLPVPSLLLFLAYSAWHFGTEPEHAQPSPGIALLALALGALPIVSAASSHPKIVGTIFSAMLGSRFSIGNVADTVHLDTDPVVTTLVAGLGVLALPVLLVSLAGIGLGVFDRHPAERLKLAASTALTVLLFRVCDPLSAFAVYFCAWHTPEHLVATSVPGASGMHGTLLQNVRANLRAGLWPWLASLTAVGCLWLPAKRTAASYQSELFIVLSVLTVPHMALNELRPASTDKRNLPKPHGVSFS